MLRLTLALMLVSAALGNLNALRGHHHKHKHHMHKHHMHKHEDMQPQAAMRFQRAGTKATSEPDTDPPGTPPGKYDVTKKSDEVKREGLGENVPYKGIDCKLSLLIYTQPVRPARPPLAPLAPLDPSLASTRPARPTCFCSFAWCLVRDRPL